MTDFVPARHVDGRPYVPGIDGLRALAVIAVIIYHLLPLALPGGFVGVDMFFVISGYVVTGSMARDADRPFGSFLVAFYARRFRRIVPALVALLLATALASAALIPPAWLSNAVQKTGYAAFFGFSNFVLAGAGGGEGYFSPRTTYNPFTHTWSLAVEEQFYLLFPLILYASLGRNVIRANSRALTIVGLLCVLSFGYSAWASSAKPVQAYYMLPSRFWELGIGALLYLVGADNRAALTRKLGNALTSALGATAIIVALVFAREDSFPFPWALPAVFGSALLIAGASTAENNTINRLLGSRIPVAFGLMSYSLYLWHWPIYTIMRWTVGLDAPLLYTTALLLTVSAGWLSYRMIEVPTQNMHLLRRIPSIAVVALGLLAMMVGAKANTTIFYHPKYFGMTAVSTNPQTWQSNFVADLAGGGNCEVAQVSGSNANKLFAPVRCSQGAALQDRRLFVAGDSHSMAYERMLFRAARDTGVSVYRFARGGCAWAGMLGSQAELDPGCRAYREKSLRQLLTLARPGDIVFLASLRLPRLSEQFGLSQSERAELAAYQQQGMRPLAGEADAQNLVQDLRRAGLIVLLDLPKPIFRAPPFRCADPFNRMNPVCRPGFSLPRTWFEQFRLPVVQAIRRVVETNPGTVVWDPLPALCSNMRCTAYDGNTATFFDGDHLTGYGNELLYPGFVAALKQAADRKRPIMATRSGRVSK